MAAEIVDNGPSDVTEAEEWLNSPEYQAFVETAAKHCRCSHGPCDGVLAGGMCDELNLFDEDDDEWTDYDYGDEYDD